MATNPPLPRSARLRPPPHTHLRGQASCDVCSWVSPALVILGPSPWLRPIRGHEHGWRGLPPWDSPDNVDGPVGFIFLQHQDAGPLRIVWVVLNHLSLVDTGENLADQNTIGGKLVIAMLRDSYIATRHQLEYLLEGFAHSEVVRRYRSASGAEGAEAHPRNS